MNRNVGMSAGNLAEGFAGSPVREVGPIFGAMSSIELELIAIDHVQERLQNCLNRLRVPAPRGIETGNKMDVAVPGTVQGRLDDIANRAADSAMALHALIDQIESALA